jgi:lipoate-protein ligase A
MDGGKWGRFVTCRRFTAAHSIRPYGRLKTCPTMLEIRLLIDPPASGAWNMAVDEALLETAATAGQATLRFYEWQEPTLSLGHFQSVSERQQHVASRDCPLVRRASGGGAILHDRELTYSVAISQRDARSTAASELYDIFHETLTATLRELGIAAELYRITPAVCRGSSALDRGLQPFLCFQRRTCSDIVYGGAKIVGSAQRRRRGAVLQHGSILLARSQFAPELPGIEDLAGVTIEPDALPTRWPPHLASRLRASFRTAELSQTEQCRAEALIQGRFAAAEYLQRR